ncbi:hypothetical protein C0991_010017 [Blastosporella zonata]|nr:hypothetical protein C0991_010017 [Blastosporella zonata]
MKAVYALYGARDAEVGSPRPSPPKASPELVIALEPVLDPPVKALRESAAPRQSTSAPAPTTRVLRPRLLAPVKPSVATTAPANNGTTKLRPRASIAAAAAPRVSVQNKAAPRPSLPTRDPGPKTAPRQSLVPPKTAPRQSLAPPRPPRQSLAVLAPKAKAAPRQSPATIALKPKPPRQSLATVAPKSIAKRTARPPLATVKPNVHWPSLPATAPSKSMLAPPKRMSLAPPLVPAAATKGLSRSLLSRLPEPRR